MQFVVTLASDSELVIGCRQASLCMKEYNEKTGGHSLEPILRRKLLSYQKTYWTTPKQRICPELTAFCQT